MVLPIDNVDDIDLLSGVGRALCLDKVGENDGEAHSHIEIVLHHKVFLIRKIIYLPGGRPEQYS